MLRTVPGGRRLTLAALFFGRMIGWLGVRLRRRGLAPFLFLQQFLQSLHFGDR
jgi:hypothetical protein